MKKLGGCVGMISLLALIGCQTQEQVSSPDIVNEEKSGKSPVAGLQDAVFDSTKINITSAPIAYRDDTLPPDTISKSPNGDGIPLRKAAATTWTQLTGMQANDVAVGWYYYGIDKTTLKLKRYVSGSWQVVPGPIVDGTELGFKRICASKSRLSPNVSDPKNEWLVAIASNGGTYQYIPDAIPPRWQYLTGGGYGVDISVSYEGRIHYIGYNNTLYRWETNHWDAIAGQAGLRVSSDDWWGTYLVSTANRLWSVSYSGSSSSFTGAYNVNDVCGQDTPAGYDSANDKAPLPMHSGSGFSYYLSSFGPNWGWTLLGGDSNTRNIACANSEQANWTKVIQTNNNGDIFYTQFPRP